MEIPRKPTITIGWFLMLVGSGINVVHGGLLSWWVFVALAIPLVANAIYHYRWERENPQLCIQHDALIEPRPWPYADKRIELRDVQSWKYFAPTRTLHFYIADTEHRFPIGSLSDSDRCRILEKLAEYGPGREVW